MEERLCIDFPNDSALSMGTSSGVRKRELKNGFQSLTNIMRFLFKLSNLFQDHHFMAHFCQVICRPGPINSSSNYDIIKRVHLGHNFVRLSILLAVGSEVDVSGIPVFGCHTVHRKSMNFL